MSKPKPFRTFVACFIGLIVNIIAICALLFFVQTPVSYFAFDCLAAAQGANIPQNAYYINVSEAYLSAHNKKSEVVNMYAGPNSKKYACIKKIDNGTVIKVRSKANKNGWILITSGYSTGWVKSDFVMKKFKDTSDNTKPDTTYNFVDYYIKIKSDKERMSLLMKKSPSEDGTFLKRAPNGAAVKLVGTSKKAKDWAYIEYRGVCGWVLKEYLKEGSNGKTSETVLPKNSLNKKATVKKVTDMSAKVRIGPGNDYVFLDYVYSNDSITVLGSEKVGSDTWYYVRFKSPSNGREYDETGWLNSKYVKLK